MGATERYLSSQKVAMPKYRKHAKATAELVDGIVCKNRYRILQGMYGHTGLWQLSLLGRDKTLQYSTMPVSRALPTSHLA